MAVAGLHNVSVLDSSFIRESQSPGSRQWELGNQDRPSTRASSLLQMWRELEGEHVMSHSPASFGESLRQRRSDWSNADSGSTYSSNRPESESGDHLDVVSESENECGVWTQGQMRSQSEHECSDNSSSEQADLGDVERERVRQIFQEWMNSGTGDGFSNVSHINNCSSAQWLGENERVRVRIVREWVQMNSQQRGTCGSRREQLAELGSQIEQVRDGLVVNHCEIGARRAIRRLCGRQALLDLLIRSERERKSELQDLLEHRAVSDFTHRNRIQSLLRGRFLRNEKFIQNERSTSGATSELGLLRQRQTVSGLREGFLSRLDFVNGPANSAQSDILSNHDINGHRTEQTQSDSNEIDDASESANEQRNINRFHIYRSESESSLEGVLHEIHDPSEPANVQRNIKRVGTDNLESESNAVRQESTAQVEQRQEQVLENEEREQQQLSNIEFIEILDVTSEDVVGNWQQTNANEWSQETMGIEGSGLGHLVQGLEVFHEHCEQSSDGREAHMLSGHTSRSERNTVQEQDMSPQVEELEESVTESHEVIHEHYQQNSEGRDPYELSRHSDQSGRNTVEEPDMSSQVEELLENEESDWLQLANIEFSGRRDGIGEVLDRDSQENTANQRYHATSQYDDEAHSHLQDSNEEWQENGLQEAMDNWLDGHSGEETAPIGRSGTFYFPDDDNVYSVELRELLSRRSVSNLLRSSFRESLDQLIQSYVERQGHASSDWELDGTSSSPVLEEQFQEQQSGDLSAGQSDATERTPIVLPSPPVTPSQPLWDQELHDANLPRHRRLEIEWEIINDLRLDMARLQQRMHNMQRMLEACMDMQLELQRSVRQEVSAALNMSAGSADTSKDGLPNEESKWDCVRKGICCICCNNSIVCLLYRCAHMCTCSECANKLVQGQGKCPMCQAPVIEMVHAYSIQ